MAYHLLSDVHDSLANMGTADILRTRAARTAAKAAARAAGPQLQRPRLTAHSCVVHGPPCGAGTAWLHNELSPACTQTYMRFACSFAAPCICTVCRSPSLVSSRQNTSDAGVHRVTGLTGRCICTAQCWVLTARATQACMLVLLRSSALSSQRHLPILP